MLVHTSHQAGEYAGRRPARRFAVTSIFDLYSPCFHQTLSENRRNLLTRPVSYESGDAPDDENEYPGESVSFRLHRDGSDFLLKSRPFMQIPPERCPLIQSPARRHSFGNRRKRSDPDQGCLSHQASRRSAARTGCPAAKFDIQSEGFARRRLIGRDGPQDPELCLPTVSVWWCTRNLAWNRPLR